MFAALPSASSIAAALTLSDAGLVAGGACAGAAATLGAGWWFFRRRRRRTDLPREAPSLAQDLAARQRAIEELRASEARYRDLVERSPLAIIEIDVSPIVAWMQGLKAAGVTDFMTYFAEHAEACRSEQNRTRVCRANNAAAGLLRGASPDQVRMHWTETQTDEVWQMRSSCLMAIWEERWEAEGETLFRAFDGTLIRAIYRWWVPAPNGRRETERAQLVLVDLNDITRAENALIEERERLSVTLAAMTEGVITVDNEGRVQFMNAAAERLTGWTATAAIGADLADVCGLRHARTLAPVLLPRAIELAETRPGDLPRETQVLARTGESVAVEGRAVAMYGSGHQVIGSVLVLRDITERARLESELQRSARLESLGLLAGGIAHDFNNLLTVVMGNLTLALLDTQVSTAGGKWLREAERGVMRTRDLTQQLLTFAKGGDPVRTAVALPDIVRETAQFALHGAQTRCTYDFAADLWSAEVDKGQIAQVVQNLVINANQAMPQGGQLRLELRNDLVAPGQDSLLRPGQYVRLTCSDTGLGIPPENLGRIFDPYFTTKTHGFGLGLATVYSIVKKHQGHIEVESVCGQGTTFRLWLPAAHAQPAAVRVSTPALRVRGGRILLMDDEEPIRQLALSLFPRLGYQTIAVADGEVAVREFARARAAGQPFDAVMLDLTVPGGMGGIQTLQKLRELDPQVRAIVSSGYSSDPIIGNYRQHGFCGVVPKPYRMHDLTKTLECAITGERADALLGKS